MRELKFRVYHKEKGMLSVYGFNKKFVFIDDMNSPEPGENILTREDCVLMQYTGLKDVRGIEIYEGDVMKIKSPVDDLFFDVKIDKTGDVRYEPEHGGFIVEWEYSQHQHHKNLTCDIACAGEIIGNIHETPELIAKKQEI